MKNISQVTWFNNNLDQHAKWTINIANKIKDIFPECGIGIAGSISLGKHTKKSDVDLLVIDKSFKKNMQCVFFKENSMETNLLCLNPNTLENRLNTWVKRFNGQHITYINMCKIIYDPTNQLLELKKEALKYIKKVQTSDVKIIKSLEEELQNIDENNLHFINNYVTKLVSLWFIKNGIKNLSKEEDKSSFKIISAKDHKLYEDFEEILNNIYNLKKILQINLTIWLDKHNN